MINRPIAAHSMQRCTRYLAVICVVVGLTGCFRAPHFTPTGVLQDEDVSRAVCHALPTIERGSLRAFRALLDTTIVTPMSESVSFRYAVVAKQPDDLRVDLLPTEGAYTLGLLVVRGSSALVIDAQQRSYSVDSDSKRLFSSFFGLEGITPEIIKALIVGELSQVMCSHVTVYRVSDERVQVVDMQRRYAWEVDVRTGRVHRVLLLDESLTKVQAEASRSFAPGEETVKISMYKPVAASATMQIRKFVLNPEISPTLFEVAPPQGYREQR
jgi:hypothetical protein